MAKATAHCTCKKCGKEFTREAIKRNRDEANNWEAWAVATFDECGDCYAARMAEERKAKGLVAEIRMSSALETPTIYVVFDGDTYPYKDALKAAGCRWTDSYPDANPLGALLAIKQPPKRWVAAVKTAEELDALLAQFALADVKYPSDEAMAVYTALVSEKSALDKADAEAETAQKREAAIEALGPIPAWPENVKAQWPSGGTWNGKIYGKPGTHRIYIGGKEIAVSDDEAAKMEETAAARKEWHERKKKIESM